MRLWLVDDRDRWGFSLNIVRAETDDEAIRLVLPHYDARPTRRPEVTPLPLDGPAAILWCHDESPDTGGE